MDTHLSRTHGLRCAISHIRTSSHQLEIETCRFRGIPPKSRICKLCNRCCADEGLTFGFQIICRKVTGNFSLRTCPRSDTFRPIGSDGKSCSQTRLSCVRWTKAEGLLTCARQRYGKKRREKTRKVRQASQKTAKGHLQWVEMKKPLKIKPETQSWGEKS